MKTTPQYEHRKKSGQAIIFLMMVMVIGLLVILWNFDLHNIVSTKVRIDNAADSGALSAARWQGITLNMIGELNLIQAAYVCEELTDPYTSNDISRIQAEVDGIEDLRRRLSLNGPLMGYMAAQSAAFLNLDEKDERNLEEGFATALAERGADFESSGDYYQGSVEAPYSGAWGEYGALLSAIGHNKMVVESANTEFFQFYSSSAHTLLSPAFYSAVSAQNWCWFYSEDEAGEVTIRLLGSYLDYTSWGALPSLSERSGINSEYFGLDLSTREMELDWMALAYYGTLTNYYEVDASRAEYYQQQSEYLENELSSELGLSSSDLAMFADAQSLSFPWYYYNYAWMSTNWLAYADYIFEENVSVRAEYRYQGADSSVFCYINAVNFTPNMYIDTDFVYRQASAKAFGYLEVDGERRTPNYFAVVLPAFHDVRLLHNNLSTASQGVTYPGFDEHIYDHLPDYLENGPDALHDDCWYCRQLQQWEDPDFRETGMQWLEDYECIEYEGIGGGSSGPSIGRG